jgi:probable O-glycosylation ligase (exosortase A-associated)
MNIAFIGLLFVLASEYLGLGKFFPIVDALRLTLGVLLLLFISVIYKHGISEPMSYRQSKLMIFFIVLTALALIHGLIRSYAVPILKQEIGYFFLIIVIFYLLESRKKLDLLLTALVLFHVLLVLINLGKLGAMRAGAFKAGYFLGDGNDFAWGLNIVLPMSIYLIFSAKKQLFKLIGITGAVILLLGIIGTASRGAFLALVSGMLYYLFFISKRKLGGLIFVVLIALVGIVFAPQEYYDRIGTIRTFEEDSSAMGRITAWGAAINMALDHPVLGVGAGSFNSAYGRFYRKFGDPSRWISTHNIYFKILSEYSFLGVTIYLLIIYNNLAQNRRNFTLLAEAKHNCSINPAWPGFLNMSIITYVVGGMFLTGVNYPHVFLLTALTMVTNRIIHQDIKVNMQSDSSGKVAEKPSRPVYFR